MDADYISLMQKLAPDLAGEMAGRALMLERISVLQPVGRRQLSAETRLPEREIRNTAAILKELGYIEMDASGMRLTPEAADILPAAAEFARAFGGITELERRLCGLLPIDDAVIARGDADTDGHVLQDVGRLCGARFRDMVRSGDTVAVSDGRTLAAVVRNMPVSSPLNVMVVPARGGMGRSAELQANTMASGLAEKLGGHYRLMHLPDQLDDAAMQEMLKVPDVSEVMDRVRRADIIIHGISEATEDGASERRLSRKEMQLLREKTSGECFGSYYDIEGNCLLRLSRVGEEPGRLNPGCRRIAAAAGSSKAEAIIAVLRHERHALLATDEGAARRMLTILEGKST